MESYKLHQFSLQRQNTEIIENIEYLNITFQV